MKQVDKIGFEDIFDLKDIEKVFTQSLEFDILKLMDKWEREKRGRKETSFPYPFQKDKVDLYIEEIVRNVIKEEIRKGMLHSGIFDKRFFRFLEYQGFVRNCPFCIDASKDYGSIGHDK